jgi:spermidine/putrescine transport system substrate-binding protein
VRITRRQMLVSGSMLLASACTRPGSSSAPQRFGTRLSGPNVQVLDRHLVLALPNDVVDPATVSSFVANFGVQTRVVPGHLTDLTDVGQADIALVDDTTLASLITGKLVEPIDRNLVANRKLLVAPFDSPPYDKGNRHGVVKDYMCAGFAVSAGAAPAPPSTWRGFFRLATTLPNRVAVPPDPDLVIGAALTAAGHDWNSSSGSDLNDAADILLPLRNDLVVAGTPARRELPAPMVAALCFGPGFVSPRTDVRFVVPAEGTLARARCYCIPLYAPDPVSAHAWLNHTLDPSIAAAETRFSQRATPVGPAVYQLPASMLANEAVFPPALPQTPLTFADVSPQGVDLRKQLWADLLTARRRRIPAR